MNQLRYSGRIICSFALIRRSGADTTAMAGSSLSIAEVAVNPRERKTRSPGLTNDALLGGGVHTCQIAAIDSVVISQIFHLDHRNCPDSLTSRRVRNEYPISTDAMFFNSVFMASIQKA